MSTFFSYVPLRKKEVKVICLKTQKSREKFIHSPGSEIHSINPSSVSLPSNSKIINFFTSITHTKKSPTNLKEFLPSFRLLPSEVLSHSPGNDCHAWVGTKKTVKGSLHPCLQHPLPPPHIALSLFSISSRISPLSYRGLFYLLGVCF